MKTIVLVLCAAQDSRCFYCDTLFEGPQFPTDKGLPRNVWTRDHLWPDRAGGGRPYNIVLACRRCNVTKSDRYPTAAEIEKARLIYARADMLGRAILGKEWTWPDDLLANSSRCAPGIATLSNGRAIAFRHPQADEKPSTPMADALRPLVEL